MIRYITARLYHRVHRRGGNVVALRTIDGSYIGDGYPIVGVSGAIVWERGIHRVLSLSLDDFERRARVRRIGGSVYEELFHDLKTRSSTP